MSISVQYSAFQKENLRVETALGGSSASKEEGVNIGQISGWV